MMTAGAVLFVLAILAGLTLWGFRQWRNGRLIHVPFLPKPPAAPASTTEMKP